MPVAIVGMHRSGTSMVAQLLHLCGLYLGLEEELLPPASENPEGFWENARFIDLGETLLNSLGGDWDSPPPPRISPADVPSVRKRAEALVEDFATKEPWGWKDPRASLVLPFWLGLCPDLRIVVCMRNPLNVAASLSARHSTSYWYGLALWRQYYGHILEDTNPEQRIVTHYDSYFSQPEIEARRLVEFAGLKVSKRVLENACKAVNGGLRHHVYTMADLVEAGVSTEICELYATLCDLAGLPTERPTRTTSLESASTFMRGLAQQRRRETKASSQRAGLSGSPPATAQQEEWRKVVDEQLARLGRLEEALGELIGERQQQREALAAVEARLQASNEDLARQLGELREVVQSSRDDLALTLGDIEADMQLMGPSDDPTREYSRVVRRVRAYQRKHLPQGAAVLVVSKGDATLLDVEGVRAAHFPQGADGQYAWHYPSGSLSAIAHLEALRAAGAEFLVLPEPAYWWLDHYSDFAAHLEASFRELPAEDSRCRVFALGELVREQGPTELARILAEQAVLLGRSPSVLDWASGLPRTPHLNQAIIVSPPDSFTEKLPYADRSIDIVVTHAQPERMQEAWRVASVAVVQVNNPPHMEPLDIEWIDGGPSRRLGCSVIVVGTDDHVALEGCLRSLSETLPRSMDVEILVVANSTDATPEPALRWSELEERIRVVRPPDRVGLAEGRQLGAKDAAFEDIVFVDQDVIALPGWLHPLVSTLERTNAAGVVTGRVLAPDGSLAEAGGIVDDAGTYIPIGRGEHDIDAPSLAFLRPVDVSSGLVLATTRRLFDRLGGFRDEQPWAGSVAFCIAARAAGEGVYYQPESTVVLRWGSRRIDAAGEALYKPLTTDRPRAGSARRGR